MYLSDFVRSLRARLKNLIPIELRDLRWGYRDPLRRRIWKLLASRKINKELYSQLLHSSQSRYFGNVYSMHEDPGVAGLFASITPHDKQEGVWMLDRPALIEPDSGWIIANPAHLIENCLIDSWSKPRPQIKRFVRTKVISGDVVKVPAVVHLRDTGETNYYHAMNDLIGGRMRLAQQCGLSPEIPLLIGRKLHDQPFFQDLLGMTELGSRKLIIQDGQFVRSEKTFFFQTKVLNKKHADYLTELLKVPDADPKADRRIFLKRGAKAGRGLVNAAEVEDISRQFGFEMIDTAGMTLAQQISLFAAARHLIGIHGAGLFNIIFRKNAPLSLLELQPPLSYGVPDPHAPMAPYPHFFWWTYALGFRYDVVMGLEVPGLTPTPYQPFAVDAAEVEAKIRKMLNA